LRKITYRLFLLGLISTVALLAQAQTPEPRTTLPPELMTKLENLRDTALSSDYAWRQVAGFDAASRKRPRPGVQRLPRRALLHGIIQTIGGAPSR
jgi:hypothetical protein